MIHESSGSQMETALPCVSKYMVVCHMTGVEEGDGELLVFDGWGSGMLSTLAEPSSRRDCPAQDASITLFRNAVWFLRLNWLFFEILSFVVLTVLIILLNYNCIYVQCLFYNLFMKLLSELESASTTCDFKIESLLRGWKLGYSYH